MSPFLRHKQPIVTRLNPHQGNKRFIKSKAGGEAQPAIVISQSGTGCGCEFVTPATDCESICTYTVTAYNYSPDTYAWSVTGGTVIAGGTSGDNFVTVSTTASTDQNINIDVTATEGGTAVQKVQDFTQTHTDANLDVVFIGPDINDVSFVENAAISSFDFSVVFTGTITDYSLVGSWPTGLSIDSNGVLTGTPTGVAIYGGLQVRASGPRGTADTNPFTVTITSSQAQSLVVSEFVAAECSYNSGLGETNCQATGTYVATPIGYSFPITSWAWEITSSTGGSPQIISGQNTDTIQVRTTAADNVSVTLKCVASNGQGETAEDITQFFFTHTDDRVPIAWDGTQIPDPPAWYVGDQHQIDYGTHFTGTIQGYLLIGQWPPVSTINSSTGQVDVDLQAEGTYLGAGVRAYNAVDSADSDLFDVTVTQAPPIFTGTIPNMTVENGEAMTPYDASGHFTTGGPVSQYFIAGNPAWMTIDQNTGVISGTANEVGTTVGITVTGSNSGGSDDSNAWQMEVTAVAVNPPVYDNITPDLGDLTVDELMTPYDFSTHYSGDPVDSYSISITPPGLSFNTTTGVLSGTPTTIANTTGVTVTATNTGGSTPTNAFNINVIAQPANPPIFSGTIPDQTSTVGTPYSLDVSSYFSSGGAPTSYSLANNPAWMSIDNAGLISGTPDAEAITNGITVTGTNGDGSDASNAWQMDAQASAGYGDDYVFTWETLSDNESLTLGLHFSGDYNFNADWGDGTNSDITSNNDPDATHQYATAGTYTVRCSGQLTRWRFVGIASLTRIREIIQMGDTQLASLEDAYKGSTGITSLNSGQCNTPLLTQLKSAFHGLNNVADVNVTTMDTSSVTKMTSTFEFCGNNTNPAIDVSDWNISSMDDASRMFQSSGFQNSDYDALLIAWAAQAPSIQSNVTFHGGSAKYSSGPAADARLVLTGTYNWTITDGGPA